MKHVPAESVGAIAVPGWHYQAVDGEAGPRHGALACPPASLPLTCSSQLGWSISPPDAQVPVKVQGMENLSAVCCSSD